MDSRREEIRKPSAWRALVLLTRGVSFIAGSRFLRSLPVVLAAHGERYGKRMLAFSREAEFVRAEQNRHPLLGRLMYCVCGEGESLRALVERSRPPARDPRS